jgi:hypothetical protein
MCTVVVEYRYFREVPVLASVTSSLLNGARVESGDGNTGTGSVVIRPLQVNEWRSISFTTGQCRYIQPNCQQNLTDRAGPRYSRISAIFGRTTSRYRYRSRYCSKSNYGAKYISVPRYQCCGSGSGIRCLFAPRIRDPDPGSGMIFFPDPGSRIPDPYHVPHSRFYL